MHFVNFRLLCYKVTDGRRAEVEFTKDWELDSNR